MRIVSWSVLSSFAEKHPETKVSLDRWRTLIKAARWKSMDDVRAAAPNAKILNGERARLEVAGGNFRLIVAFDFGRSIVFIKFIGTHAEYDRIDALSISLFQGMTMEIRPIKNDDDHSAALREIEKLWGAAPGTEEGDKLDILVTLVEKYEERRWPDADASDPI